MDRFRDMIGDGVTVHDQKTICDLTDVCHTHDCHHRWSANRFKNLAMKVVVDKAPIKDSEVAGFIDDLKKIPCLHFKAIPAEAAPNANEPPETLAAEADKD